MAWSPICTPSVLHGSVPPWAQETPTPTSRNRVPSFSMDGDTTTLTPPLSPKAASGLPPAAAPAPAVLTQELLRTVCAPYFDQMLVALECALKGQTVPVGKMASPVEEATRRGGGPPLLPVPNRQRHGPFHMQLDPTPEGLSATGTPEVGEQSEQDDHGAFSFTVSPSCADPLMMIATRSCPAAIPARSAGGLLGMSRVVSAERPSREHGHAHGSPAGPVGEKSTMVCHHWKSKGWCRMESQCKFLHPENKRGVGSHHGYGGDAAAGTGDGHHGHHGGHHKGGHHSHGGHHGKHGVAAARGSPAGIPLLMPQEAVLAAQGGAQLLWAALQSPALTPTPSS